MSARKIRPWSQVTIVNRHDGERLTLTATAADKSRIYGIPLGADSPWTPRELRDNRVVFPRADWRVAS